MTYVLILVVIAALVLILDSITSDIGRGES